MTQNLSSHFHICTTPYAHPRTYTIIQSKATSHICMGYEHPLTYIIPLSKAMNIFRKRLLVRKSLVIEFFLKYGLLVHHECPCNTKKSCQWTQQMKKSHKVLGFEFVNNLIILLHPLMANTCTLPSRGHESTKWCTVLISIWSFLIPLCPNLDTCWI